MDQQTIRVMVVDDHDIVRLSIGTALKASPDFELIAEARNGQQAVELYDQFWPDVVLMDLKMPVMDGIEAARQIRSKNSSAIVVALTTYSDQRLVRSALEAGITSYLLKDTTLDGLTRAVRDVYNNKIIWSPEATATLIHAATTPPNQMYTLTRSEWEVLRHLANGSTNQQIAHCLTVSVSTVKKHVSSILNKLDLRNRAEAAAWAIRHSAEEVDSAYH